MQYIGDVRVHYLYLYSLPFTSFCVSVNGSGKNKPAGVTALSTSF